jgi:hypothetical protein
LAPAREKKLGSGKGPEKEKKSDAQTTQSPQPTYGAQYKKIENSPVT